MPIGISALGTTLWFRDRNGWLRKGRLTAITLNRDNTTTYILQSGDNSFSVNEGDVWFEFRKAVADIYERERCG